MIIVKSGKIKIIEGPGAEVRLEAVLLRCRPESDHFGNGLDYHEIVRQRG